MRVLDRILAAERDAALFRSRPAGVILDQWESLFDDIVGKLRKNHAEALKADEHWPY